MKYPTPFAGITLAGSTGIISAVPVIGTAPRESEAAFIESDTKL